MLNLRPSVISTKQVLGILTLIVSVTALSFLPEQSDFPIIITSATIAFVAYYYIGIANRPSIKHIFIAGILIRIVLLFAFPNLSDDIYRFVWDGQLTAKGMNPYGYLPSALTDMDQSPYWQMLYAEMNSPEYYTIYPPFTQLIFYLSTWAGEQIWWSSFIVKICFLIAEVFTFIGLLKIIEYYNTQRTKLDTGVIALYFLNPLILIEGIGNLHFEILMVCFVVWAIYYSFVREHLFVAALLFVLSIATKLLPLMFLPFFLFHLTGKRRILFFSYGFVLMIIAFLPIGLGLDFAKFGSSIDLYFQKFEFNAGIYYILRFLGRLWSGYNLIHYVGPLLGVTAVVLIMKKAYRSLYTIESFIQFAFFSFCTYLFLATTVHPWYLTIPILLSVFIQWRFALLWSFLIMLSYINYSYPMYYENLWIVAMEYLLVMTMLYYELNGKRNIQNKIVSST